MTTKILLVEDDRFTLESLSECLRWEGFEVIASSTGEEAISLALSDHPNVIVMDLGLPGMSGIEAAEVMKQNGQTSDIPIIALSGRPAEPWERAALEAGMSMYLTKPAGAADIINAIARCLEGGI